MFTARECATPKPGGVTTRQEGRIPRARYLASSWLAELAEHRVYGVESRINLFSDLKVEENKKGQRMDSNRVHCNPNKEHHPTGRPLGIIHHAIIACPQLVLVEKTNRVMNASTTRGKKERKKTSPLRPLTQSFPIRK